MTPVNLLLIAITAILSWMAFNNRKLADRLILWPPAIDRHRQYDRLVTYGFIHADWSHLIFNMITLFFFGGFIESVMVQLTGSYLTYPAFYIGALLVSLRGAEQGCRAAHVEQRIRFGRRGSPCPAIGLKGRDDQKSHQDREGRPHHDRHGRSTSRVGKHRAGTAY